MKNKDIILCECNSSDHQMIFLYSDDEENGNKYPMCYVHVHLNKRPFIDRLIYGIKYIFGYKCRYGAFDEFIFNPDDSEKIEKLLKYLKNENG
jgi:hypothetical protein